MAFGKIRNTEGGLNVINVFKDSIVVVVLFTSIRFPPTSKNKGRLHFLTPIRHGLYFSLAN